MQTRSLTIAEVARRHGLTHRALRFYEAKELIRPARDGTRRLYGEREEATLRLNACGQGSGLSLEEIRAGLIVTGIGPPRLVLPRRLLAQRREAMEQEHQRLTGRLRDVDVLLVDAQGDAVSLEAG